MAWIKFDKDLVNDPRIIRAAEGLSCRYTMSIEGTRGAGFAVGSDLSEKESIEVMRNAVIGALVTLWVYADTHITGRNVLRISVTAIDQLVGIDGFCDAVGPEWIKEDEDTYGVFTVLPGYCEKNGLESKEKRKSSNAERQRRYREKQRLFSNAERNAVTNATVTALDQDLDQDLDQKKKTKANGRKRPSVPIPKDFSISPRVREWAESKGFDSLEAHFEHFVGVASAKGYAYADWDQALMNAIRDDWAKVRAAAAPDYSAVIANLKD